MNPDEIVVSPEQAQRCRAAFLEKHPEFLDCQENWDKLQLVLEHHNLPVSLRVLDDVLLKFRDSFRMVWSKPRPNLSVERDSQDPPQKQPVAEELRRPPEVMNVLEYRRRFR